MIGFHWADRQRQKKNEKRIGIEKKKRYDNRIRKIREIGVYFEEGMMSE